MYFVVFFFKQKTAYEMRISDWSSDVCSSDLRAHHEAAMAIGQPEQIVGAQPRLHVFEGHVIDRLSPREGMAHVAQHLARGRTDVDLLPRDAQRVHQRPGIALDRKSTRLNSSH